MTYSSNENALPREGADFTKLAGGVKVQTKPLDYSSHHINKVVQEIRAAGLQLRSTAGDTQLETLPKVLQERGSRGLNTYEGVAAGYLRIATRIKDLEEVWLINSLRENVIGPDGLFHKGVARYILIGKRKNIEQQRVLNLEDV